MKSEGRVTILCSCLGDESMSVGLDKIVVLHPKPSVPQGRERVGCQGSKIIVWMARYQYHGRVFELDPGWTVGWQGPRIDNVMCVLDRVASKTAPRLVYIGEATRECEGSIELAASRTLKGQLHPQTSITGPSWQQRDWTKIILVSVTETFEVMN